MAAIVYTRVVLQLPCIGSFNQITLLIEKIYVTFQEDVIDCSALRAHTVAILDNSLSVSQISLLQSTRTVHRNESCLPRLPNPFIVVLIMNTRGLHLLHVLRSSAIGTDKTGEEELYYHT